MFFLGTANARWLADLDVPLCLAYHHLAGRRTLPRARAPWLLDSGAYGRLTKHGGWDDLSPRAYVDGVRRLADEVGNLAFAGQMDWLVGDDQLRRTGLPVAAHQWNTVINYVELVELWGGDPVDCPIIPSLQGRTERDFHACWDLFSRYGVDLATLPRVGIGSIASHEATPETAAIVESLFDRAPLTFHGYGVKGGGLSRYGHLIASSDTQVLYPVRSYWWILISNLPLVRTGYEPGGWVVFRYDLERPRAALDDPLLMTHAERDHLALKKHCTGLEELVRTYAQVINELTLENKALREQASSSPATVTPLRRHVSDTGDLRC
jgi:hypothetical protein